MHIHIKTLQTDKFDERLSGDDPMTGAQASYLKTLSDQAHDPGIFDEDLTKAEASKLIDVLKLKLKLEEAQ